MPIPDTADDIWAPALSRPVYPRVVLFGGAGFIGLHLARHLLSTGLAGRVWLADLRVPAPEALPVALQDALADERLCTVFTDVRYPVDDPRLPEHPHLVANLAAVHREPGPSSDAYFETNLLGAQHVCEWAERAGCRQMIFTSSIAVYGSGANNGCGRLMDEAARPAPETPYGMSKLVAEQIHRAWRIGAPDRQLLVVRPGVVFGPGEGGNVTRLIHAVLGRYFIYAGNRRTLKAGGYVKELCQAIEWGLDQLEAGRKTEVLFNFTRDPVPTVADYVCAICRARGVRRRVPAVPYWLVLAAALAVGALARPLGLNPPINSTRVRKVAHDTPVEPGWLRRTGYQFRYSLEEAFRDWIAEAPQDWRVGEEP